jgi:Cu(I)/Ag(I) efflux system membrane fusion protein
MNKNILYVTIAIIVGLLAGWAIFGNNRADAITTSEMSDMHDHAGETVDAQWTCSMHPQIMLPEPGDCPICGMDLIPAETSAEGLAANEIKMTENAMALANIQTTIIEKGAVSNEDGMITLSGKIATNDENNLVQSSYFDGRLERLNVSYQGQQLTKGQLLATIYAPALVSAQQELITAASLKSTQPALYNAVRNKLRNWKFSEAQINAIESTGTVKENFPVYATVSGTVSMVMAAQGDYVAQGQPILRVSNLDTVWAEFDAYEGQIAQFKKGQQIKVITNAYPNKAFNATVSFVDPILNSATRTVTVRATLNNKEGLFKPGMFITGKIKGAVQAGESSLNIPATAVLWTGERSLVYIKTNPNEAIFEMREVTLGMRNGANYTITAGLKNGDEIVTNGTFTVDAAAQLQGKKSMMNETGVKTATVPTEDTKKGTDSKTAMPETMKMKLTQMVQDGFKATLKTYFQLNDAFVSSDAKKVSAFAKAYLKSLKSLNIMELGAMEKAHFKKSLELLEYIATSNDLNKQRGYYVTLNENIIPIAMSLDNNAKTVYVQKCPMANNNKGAVWLSVQKDIRNPYYGEAMLTCGSVIEEIK